MNARRYRGYSSFSYLESGRDFRSFELAREVDRVESFLFDLSQEQAVRVQRLLAENMVVSLHDHPMRIPDDPTLTPEYVRAGHIHTGYLGLSKSAMDVVFDNFLDGICCITSSGGWKWDDVIYDLGMRYADLARQDFLRRVETVAQIHETRASGQLALVPGLEAATMIENEVDRIDILYGFGIRQMGISYSEANQLGGGLREKNDGGLTWFGERAVSRMNALGMAIDISHCGDRTSLDVIEASRQPVFITHGGARAVWDSPRLKTDVVLLACAARGGVIGIEAAPHTTLSQRSLHQDINTVMDHFVHCVELMGIDHVGFGPDTMFGDHAGLHRVYATQLNVAEITKNRGASASNEIDYVRGLENPAECFTSIASWLVCHDYSDAEIVKVLGGNALRVLEEVW